MSKNPTQQAAREAVFSIIAAQAGIPVEKIHEDSRLQDFDLPSLTIIEIIFDIEDHFDINLPDDGADFSAETAGDLLRAVEKALQEKADGDAG